jgi:hypothetical protein
MSESPLSPDTPTEKNRRSAQDTRVPQIIRRGESKPEDNQNSPRQRSFDDQAKVPSISNRVNSNRTGPPKRIITPVATKPVNGSSVNGSSVNGSSVNGSSVNGSSVNGSPVTSTTTSPLNSGSPGVNPDKVLTLRRPGVKPPLTTENNNVQELMKETGETKIQVPKRINSPPPNETPTTSEESGTSSANNMQLARTMSRRRQLLHQHQQQQLHTPMKIEMPLKPVSDSRKGSSPEPTKPVATNERPFNTDNSLDLSTVKNYDIVQDEETFTPSIPSQLQNSTLNTDRRDRKRKRGLSLVIWNLCNEDPMRFVNPNLDPSVQTISQLGDREIEETYHVKILRGSEQPTDENLVSIRLDEKEPDENLEDFLHMIRANDPSKVIIPFRHFEYNPLHNPTVKDSTIEVHMTPDDVIKYNDIVCRLIESGQDVNNYALMERENAQAEKLTPQQRAMLTKRNNKVSRRYSRALVEILSRSTSVRQNVPSEMHLLDINKSTDFSLETCSKNWKIQLKSLRESTTPKAVKYSMTNSCIYMPDWKLQLERKKSYERAQLLYFKRTNSV